MCRYMDGSLQAFIMHISPSGFEREREASQKLNMQKKHLR